MSIDVFTGLINGFIPEPNAGLLNGILFGAKATLDPALKNQLIETGTLYILTLYGVKISLLVTATGLLFRRFLPRPIANVASIVVIIGFIWLIGFTPGVLRAGIMATISLLAITFGRQKWPLLAWILAVTIMLLLHPPWFGDLSFQLSAMASLGIIVFNSKGGSGIVFFGGAKSKGAAEVGALFAAHPSKTLGLRVTDVGGPLRSEVLACRVFLGENVRRQDPLKILRA